MSCDQDPVQDITNIVDMNPIMIVFSCPDLSEEPVFFTSGMSVTQLTLPTSKNVKRVESL